MPAKPVSLKPRAHLTPAALWIADRLSEIPTRADIAIVMRHAEREEIPPGAFGDDIPLTQHGVASAEFLGAALADSATGIRAVSSPVLRCIQTAKAILRGAGSADRVASDWRLGAPGPFVENAEVAGQLFLKDGAQEVVRRQLSDNEPPAGIRPTSEGIDILMGLIAANLGYRRCLNIYITHDSILAAFIGSLFDLTVEDSWPDYLDGLMLWRSEAGVDIAWRGLREITNPVCG